MKYDLTSINFGLGKRTILELSNDAKKSRKKSGKIHISKNSKDMNIHLISVF